MAAVEIPPADGLKLQLGAIAGNEPPSSYVEIRCLTRDNRPGPREFVPVGDRATAARMIAGLADVNVYIGGAPRVRESGTAADVERVWSLWTDCDTEAAVKALREFRPLPSIVVGTSPGRVQALWALKVPVAPAWARRANRRIAHKLGGDMAATDVARILRAIGSKNHKHQPPFPVTCRRAELDVFLLSDVVGVLPDAPGDAPQVRRSGQQARSYAGPLEALVRTVREAPEGQRNGTLFWAACRAVDEGHDCRDELRRAALDAGLPEFEVERTLASAQRRVAA